MRKHLRRLYLLSISALIVLICGCYEKEEKKDVSANEERTERKEEIQNQINGNYL